MMAPTSVSSRFSARPVMPLPKSNISLSMASVSPSILATPSPISRTVPTFCLAVAVFTPAICASISCNNVLIKFSKTFLQCRQPCLHAAVIDIAAYLNAQPANQSGILGERKIQTPPIQTGQAGLHARLQIRRQRDGAFHLGAAPLEIEFQQPLKVGQYGNITARLGRQDF